MATWARWHPTPGVRLIRQPRLPKPLSLSILSATSCLSPESVSEAIVWPKSLLLHIFHILRTRLPDQVWATRGA